MLIFGSHAEGSCWRGRSYAAGVQQLWIRTRLFSSDCSILNAELTLGLSDDVGMHWSPAGCAKGEQHLADDTATSETSLKNLSPTGKKMEEQPSLFWLNS